MSVIYLQIPPTAGAGTHLTSGPGGHITHRTNIDSRADARQ